MNWLMANRLGHIAAAKAHGRLGVDPARYPVDVSRAIDTAQLALMWRPLPRLFGIYMEARGNRGVLVNSTMTRATRRHTAAHELGHHELGHRPDPARECAIEPGSSVGHRSTGRAPGRVRAQGEIEMTAEAFAAWFLMPRKAIMAAISDLGIGRVTSAAEAYQLSLLLGTTFRATCRHLANVRLTAQTAADAWSGVQPGRLKHELASATGVQLSSTQDVDVWDLRTSTKAWVEASVGDHLILPDVLGNAAGEVPGLTAVTSAEGAAATVCTAAQTAVPIPSAAHSIEIVIHDRPLGLYVPDADLTYDPVELTS